jgi:hypothetical protein
MHLIILMKKIQGFQILSLFLFILLLSIYILIMLFCKFYAQFKEKKKERKRGRESFQLLFLNERLYFSSFLSFDFFVF